ncbi:DDE-TNP-IS1595 domain-containing protein [Vairimorpha necatrix]|uniref:DDE-TNP-IS1595 domain-containing protein n=1 Tax=Vairimorpha necatrix TaxID=6039 RepID=A0AAX4JG64_9MICR
MRYLQEAIRELNVCEDACFRNNEAAIDFFLDNGLLKRSIACRHCSTSERTVLMNISGCSGYIDGKAYRLFNYTTYQAIDLCKICKNSFIKIKDTVMEIIASESDDSYQIGGTSVRVQFDETAICNGLIVSNPSSTLDSMPGIQWIIGGIVEGNCREFVLELLPNRQSSTIEDFFRRRVKRGSIIITDGYPSYPSASRNFGNEHYIVNHSFGFINAEGDHTNNIENLWSHLKNEYR